MAHKCVQILVCSMPQKVLRKKTVPPVVDAESVSDSSNRWPRLMWVPVAAEYIGARPFFIEELIRSKEVLVVPVGNRKCIPIEELDAWANRQIKKARSEKLQIVDDAA